MHNVKVVRYVQTVSVIKMEAKVVGGKLHLAGFIYIQSKAQKSKIYWDCKDVQSGQCKTRAITSEPTAAGVVNVLKGPT